LSEWTMRVAAAPPRCALRVRPAKRSRSRHGLYVVGLRQP